MMVKTVMTAVVRARVRLATAAQAVEVEVVWTVHPAAEMAVAVDSGGEVAGSGGRVSSNLAGDGGGSGGVSRSVRWGMTGGRVSKCTGEGVATVASG
jgi:hypothetical protein